MSLSLKINLGDIAVSEKTFLKLMKSSSDSNADIWRSYPDSTVDLWNQSFVNGEYKIAYEFNPNLHQKVRSLLPKVRLLGECPQERVVQCTPYKIFNLRRWTKLRKLHALSLKKGEKIIIRNWFCRSL